MVEANALCSMVQGGFALFSWANPNLPFYTSLSSAIMAKSAFNAPLIPGSKLSCKPYLPGWVDVQSSGDIFLTSRKTINLTLYIDRTSAYQPCQSRILWHMGLDDRGFLVVCVFVTSNCPNIQLCSHLRRQQGLVSFFAVLSITPPILDYHRREYPVPQYRSFRGLGGDNVCAASHTHASVYFLSGQQAVQLPCHVSVSTKPRTSSVTVQGTWMGYKVLRDSARHVSPSSRGILG